jgi:hypothetical protein
MDACEIEKASEKVLILVSYKTRMSVYEEIKLENVKAANGMFISVVLG